MKSFLLLSIFCLYSLAITNGVAIDTVVEQENDSVQDDKTKAILDNIDEECHQPREVGRCFALFNRYAFNAETLKCEEFIYGGCGDNNNNFDSLDECERKCLKKQNEEDHTESPENHETNDKQDETNKEEKSDSTTEIISNDKST